MYERVPHGEVMKNRRGWERDRHWDRGSHEGERGGPERGEHRGGERHER
jgi:hypothetical protein